MDDRSGRAVTLQRLHEGERCVSVARPGAVPFQRLARLVDRARQIDHLVGELHDLS